MTKLVVALVIVALVITFIVQNRQAVDVRVLITTITGPLWATLTVIALLGAAVGFLLHRRGR